MASFLKRTSEILIQLNKFDDIANILKKNNIQILDIATEDGDLEDVFVQLTNH